MPRVDFCISVDKQPRAPEFRRVEANEEAVLRDTGPEEGLEEIAIIKLPVEDGATPVARPRRVNSLQRKETEVLFMLIDLILSVHFDSKYDCPHLEVAIQAKRYLRMKSHGPC